MPQSTTAQKLLTATTFLYGGLLLYASLMPFDFTVEMNLQQLWHSAWNHWPFAPQARISGSDLLSNLLLYIPLGFLLATRSRYSHMSGYRSFSIAVLICSLLSFSIELLQGLTLSRTISASDWLFNSISGLLGATVGAYCGSSLWAGVGAWTGRRWQKHPLDLFTLALAGLLAANSLAPFTPTILLSQVWRSIKRSQFNLLEGLALHPWHWWLVTKLLPYAVLTFLLANWNGVDPKKQKWFKAALLALTLALSLELAKLTIASRSFNIANLAGAAAGATLAALGGWLVAKRTTRQDKMNLAIGALTAYLLYHAWTPFNFNWDPMALRQQLPSPTELLPFYHYAMGARLDHIRLFAQNIALSGGIIYMLRLRFSWFDQIRCRFLPAMITAILLGIMQEGGQLFLPSRTPSMSDIYCFLLGGLIAASLSRPPAFKNPEISKTRKELLP